LPRKKSLFARPTKKARCKWCKERRKWTVDREWNKWVFSDESQIVIGKNKKVYIKRKDEKYSAQLVCPPSDN
jgi:hypothetical protein